MNAALYGAWRTAGTNLQPVAEWLADNWPYLAIGVTAAAVIWVFGWRPGRDDQRTRNDRVAAQRVSPPTEVQAPGTDSDLLLDAALTYYGPAGLQRLHNAINEARKEDR